MHQNNMNHISAAACRQCGGWTSFGGMSQHTHSKKPIGGRTGCTCIGGRKLEHVIKEEGYEQIRDQHGWEHLEIAITDKYPDHLNNIVEALS